MAGRYWIAWIAGLAAAGFAVAGEIASARVIEVGEEGGVPTVVLSAGRLEGLIQEAQVTLLRQADPIVHPLSGQVLGVPQEPVGVALIYQLDDHQARGKMVKLYSPPQVGDLGEYERQSLPAAPTAERELASPSAAAEPASPGPADEVKERLSELERTLEQYRLAQKAEVGHPAFAQQVWDELKSMKSYLVALDERLVELETQQGEDHNRLNAVIRGEYRPEEVKELTIRYSPDIDLRLQVAGKTLVINVERDSLHLEEVVTPAAAPPPEPAAVPARAEELPGKAENLLFPSFLGSPYVQAGSLALIAVLAVFLYYLMKRREDEALMELEDFEAQYLDDEEERES